MRIPKCYHLLVTFENVSLYLTTPIVDFSSSPMHTFFEFFKKKSKKLKFFLIFFYFFLIFFVIFFGKFRKNAHLLGNSASIRPRTVLGKNTLSTPHVASADLSEFECDTLVHARWWSAAALFFPAQKQSEGPQRPGQMSHLRTCPTSNVTLQSVFVPTRPPLRCAKQELIDKKKEENAHFPLITKIQKDFRQEKEEFEKLRESTGRTSISIDRD